MALPLKVNLRGMLVRRTATLLTIAGVSLMIMVFAIAWSLDAGLRRVFTTTSDPRLLLVLRHGSTAETTSGLARDQLPIIASIEGIDRLPASDGSSVPAVSGELVVIVNQPRRGSPHESANVIVRGVTPLGPVLRPSFKIVAGRMFTPGVNEMVAAKGMAERFQGCGLGETLVMRKTPYRIVGLFTAAGSPYESELWTDATDLGATNGRPGYSSALVAVSDPLARDRVKAAIEKDERITDEVQPLDAYFASQQASAAPLAALSTLMTIFLSVGACFAAANTMHASVLARSREIGTLRALGFSRLSILTCYVIESTVLSLAAGALGLALAWLVLAAQSGYAGTSNWTTFSEVAFRITVTWSVVRVVLIMAVVIGIIGGFLPALRAARMNIVDALRQA